MVVLVPFDGREGDGGSSTAAPDPVPMAMDVGGGEGDGGSSTVAPDPVPMDGDGRDRGGEGDSAGHVPGDGDNSALVHAASDGGGGLDRLTDLSNDLLARILAGLRDTHAAATTNVLSRRWHRVWTWVSSLFLHHHRPHDSSPVRVALAAHGERGATDIRLLSVTSPYGATADAAASWLRVAALLVSGELRFCNWSSIPLRRRNKELLDDIVEERGAFELPCFTRATTIRLSLGFLGLSLRPPGVFAELRKLLVDHVQFHGECTLDDTMMPFLEVLQVYCARGLSSLTLRLKHLIWMDLFHMRGLRRLNAEAPRLKKLAVVDCFRSSFSQDGACIVAEDLEALWWQDWYCPSLVNFNKIPRLQQLIVSPFYGEWCNIYNPTCDGLLKLLPRIHCLQMFIPIKPYSVTDMLLKESITGLPNIRILCLKLINLRHSYGATVLHFLTMCTGIVKLIIKNNFQVQIACPPICICDRPSNWKEPIISLKSLREVEILNIRGERHDLDFLRVLVRIAPELRRIRITCHRPADMEILRALVQSFARQVTCVEVSQATPSLQPH